MITDPPTKLGMTNSDNFADSLASPASVSQIGFVRLRTLIMIRWIAVGGQTFTILIVAFVLRYDLPLIATLVTIGASVLLNVYLLLKYPAFKRLSDKNAALYLAYDILQLAVLLYLTGGLHNPFSSLTVAPVIISAAVLSIRTTVLLGLLLLACVSILVFFHLPLPWTGEPHIITHVYVSGIWASVVVGMVFFSANVSRVAEEGRRMSDALMETQMILAREQRLSAVGGLAAAAAHELGTPLGTISLVATEMSREIPENSPYDEDIKLLISQSERCREILARLTLRPESGPGTPFHRAPFMSLVESAVSSLTNEDIEITVVHDPSLAEGGNGDQTGMAIAADHQPSTFHSLEIIHSLRNFIENAVDFARSEVLIKVGWSKLQVVVEITDDGPGFERNILNALGEPYITTRQDVGGMGLGVFISKTLLERTGAKVEFRNQKLNGAAILITWPRAMLEDASYAAVE
ncbi:MAG: ActS/PrrB/RegB family redox-sensitive histidine kinase [Rhodospirillales bacterium]|nr:ActS/PrrB/RegB family redox-sensitive histidine kinase [Rhodospirillales bacterium]